jgi:cellulose synthase/poly-beta-1,6-N-acetylglucosamine synthase-like glycosyltransferase
VETELSDTGADEGPVAIDSLLGQTLEDIEIIVIDDGSDDGTHAIASHVQRPTRGSN